MARKETMKQFHERRTEQRGERAEGRNTPDSRGPGPKAWTRDMKSPKQPKMPKGKGC